MPTFSLNIIKNLTEVTHRNHLRYHFHTTEVILKVVFKVEFQVNLEILFQEKVDQKFFLV